MLADDGSPADALVIHQLRAGTRATWVNPLFLVVVTTDGMTATTLPLLEELSEVDPRAMGAAVRSIRGLLSGVVDDLGRELVALGLDTTP